MEAASYLLRSTQESIAWRPAQRTQDTPVGSRNTAKTIDAKASMHVLLFGLSAVKHMSTVLWLPSLMRSAPDRDLVSMCS